MPDTREFDDALIIEKAWGTPFADFARSIYTQESGAGKNTKTSNRGAVGGMQIIPSTFNQVADKGWDINDSFDNIRAGVRYAKQMWDKAGGDPVIAAAGYYGGPGGLEKAKKGVAVSDPKNPNAPNTLQYGEQVATRMAKASQATPAATPPVVAARQEVPGPSPVADFPPVASLPVMAMADAEAYASPMRAASAGGPNAWQAFLNAMPSMAGPTPVQVADLRFGGVPAPLTLPRVHSPGKVDFSGFQGWKGRA